LGRRAPALAGRRLYRLIAGLQVFWQSGCCAKTATQDIALSTSAISTKSVVTPLPAFLFLLSLSLSPTPRHPDVVLIGAAVAFHAILEIANSFLDMFAPDLLG
jgi:hypothetical protein